MIVSGHELYLMKAMLRLNSHILKDLQLSDIHRSKDPKVWHKTNPPDFDNIDEDHLSLRDKVRVQFLFDIINRKNIDIFQDINLDQNPEKIHLHGKKIQHFINTKTVHSHYTKINVIINFRAVRGLDFIYTLLKRIDLAREMFILDIEQGHEVYIPDELSIKAVPLSY